MPIASCRAGADLRLILEFFFDLLGAAFENLPGGDLLVAGAVRVDPLEDVDQEPSHLLGLVAFDLGAIALAGGFGRLPRHSAGEDQGQKEDEAGGSDRQAIAAQELTELITETLTSGQHR